MKIRIECKHLKVKDAITFTVLNCDLYNGLLVLPCTSCDKGNVEILEE